MAQKYEEINGRSRKSFQNIYEFWMQQDSIIGIQVFTVEEKLKTLKSYLKNEKKCSTYGFYLLYDQWKLQHYMQTVILVEDWIY